MDEFEEEIRLQQLAAQGKIKDEAKLTRTDEDGVVFEFDPDKKAWFPKIDDNFLAQYQMNYGEHKTEAAIPPQPKDVNSEEYRQWYYKYYGNTTQQPPAATDQQSYIDYYKKYYEDNYAKADTSKMSEEEKKKFEEQKKECEDYLKKLSEPVDTSKMSDEDKKKYEDDKAKYDEYYKSYYASSNTANMPADDRKKYEEYYKKYYGSPQDTSSMSEEEKRKYEENKEKLDAYWRKYLENPRTAGMTEAEKEEYEKHWKEHAEAPETTKRIEEEKRKHEEYMKQYREYFYGDEYDSEDEEQKPKPQAKSKEDKEREKQEKAQKRKEQAKKKPEWFEVDETKNTNVYVTGLPEDITEEEFEEMMKKFGLIMFDPFTRKPKLKLYKDEKGAYKGDGRCCYIKNESVELCLNIMHESTLRGCKIYVERAKFERKGAFDPEKAKRKKLSNKQKKKLKERQAKLFEWRENEEAGGRQKYERIIVVKNVFDPKLFEINPASINDVRDKLRNECNNHGEVKKVILYDRHPEGVATVAFPEPEVADRVITAIHNRVFYGRTITATTWDGKTKYDIKETPEEEAKRLAEWAKFLGDEEEEERKQAEERRERKEKEGAAAADREKEDAYMEDDEEEDSKGTDGVDKTKDKADKEDKETDKAEMETEKDVGIKRQHSAPEDNKDDEEESLNKRQKLEETD